MSFPVTVIYLHRRQKENMQLEFVSTKATDRFMKTTKANWVLRFTYKYAPFGISDASSEFIHATHWGS